jgi:hypothetical protein
MEKPELSVDLLSLKLSKDIIDYIKNWMRGNYAEDIDFHRYRMKLLSSLSDAETSSDKLIMLTQKVSPKLKFNVMELVADGTMGESMARYIFGKIMLNINLEYKKILEHEADKIGAEVNVLLNRVSNLKDKIDQH